MGLTLRIIQGVTDAEYDTIETPYIEEDIGFLVGGAIRRKSFLVYSSTRFMKVVVENLDLGRQIVDLDVDIVEI